MTRHWILTAAVVFATAASVSAAPIIDVGDHELLPDTPDQTITIHVSPGEQMNEARGVDFFVMIGDGGPELADFGFDAGTPAPAITSVDLESGIFSGLSQSETQSVPQFHGVTIGGDSFVELDGLLATLTIDTTPREGVTFEPGDQWVLAVADVLEADTNFEGTSAASTPGTLTIVPEPSSLGLLGAAALMMLRRRGATGPRT